ncbi:MAG: hypothetical protein ACYC66_18380 [Chloroflexota bacterium]
MLLGRAAPSVFSARLIEPLPRKLPFVLTYTVWERAPWLLLALGVLLLSAAAAAIYLLRVSEPRHRSAGSHREEQDIQD